MDNHDLHRLVADRRASREADAQDHRLTKDIEEPAPRQPRLRYERRHRPQVWPHQTLAEG